MKAFLKYIVPYLTFTLFAFAVDAQSPWLDSVMLTLLTQKLHFLAPGWPVPVSFVKDRTGRVIQLVEDSDYGMVFKKIK